MHSNRVLVVTMSEGSGPNADPPSTDPQNQTQTPPPSQPATSLSDPAFPPSIEPDTGITKRPRDARLIHMILANLGVNGYQERVPLQLMDFAYRYTSSIVQDALHLTSETYGTTTAPSGGKINASNNDLSAITPLSLRLSIASRTHYQFNPTLPKEHYMELAQEKNRIALPSLGKDIGIRLPPERYCLTGVGWALKDDWDSEGEVDGNSGDETRDLIMEDCAEANEEEEGDETMEGFFGGGSDGNVHDHVMHEE